MIKVKLSTGTTIAYEEAGSGHPIVLLHGYCGSHRYWDEAMPLLAAQGRVIAPDLRGHGASSASEGVYTMEQLADDLAALLDELKLSRVNLIGHSLGGYIALAFADKYPERLLALGLAHSTSFPDGEAAQANRLKAADTIRTKGIAAFVDDLIPKLFADSSRTDKPELLRKAKEIGYETSADGAVGCALGMRERPDRGYVLEKLDLPILLLAGQLDGVIPPEKRFPVSKINVTAITLEGVAHMGMMEDPQAFAGAIGTFLEQKRVKDSV
ncbi:alpha/beta fold hydrolase [Cohnella silvisoli]|uniref:Alpha/beta hydrolase n=1 Tax=Cohnella silvisoli TaxID=2873699 RepID=A0ABV1L352_9BACL|nr:alpha/beta hydrolase [Cohnella silvisoli]MCD9025998.1 alpha/beta hydrolase [Cohnella silvisoli]